MFCPAAKNPFDLSPWPWPWGPGASQEHHRFFGMLEAGEAVVREAYEAGLQETSGDKRRDKRATDAHKEYNG